ncbi:hypothetical protein MRB53_041699 [Persea americana]|nr:hypothetical protein MRB53_041699 [Persea americana]
MTWRFARSMRYQMKMQHISLRHWESYVLFVPRKDSRAIPALSKEDVDFLNVQGKPDVWNASAGGLNILRTKLLATRILTSGLFKDEERFLPALFATADGASTVNDNGEDMMKRVLASVNLEDDTHSLAPLFKLYFGPG